MITNSPSISALSRRASGWALLVIFIATFGAAALASIASVNAPSFYAQLNKPSWAPPAGVFGPVWTVLYSMITLSAWLVVRAVGWHRARSSLLVYAAQLFLNALWSWLFFAWHLGAMALLDIVLLWPSIVLALVLFRRIKPLAAYLLLPYLAWVSFAAALTYAVWQRNPQLL